jgi:hypothetical protein
VHAPINISAAWRGDELHARSDWAVSLTSSDLAEIDHALAATPGLLPHEFPLTDLGMKLLRVQSTLENGAGATMIRGLPLHRYSTDDAAKLFFGLSQHIGTAISQSAAGEIVFSVRDAGLLDDDPRTRGPNTRKKLSFHTDRCDVIAFLCLNQAQAGGENEVVSSVTLYNEIARRRPDLLEVLMQPFPYKRHTVDPGNDLPFCQQPIFSLHEGHFACAFLRVLIDRAHHDPLLPSLTDQQIEALDFLESVAAEPDLHVRFHQEPGDILLLNNWVTLHRRTEFKDWPEPERKRHILRIWLSVPNSRPLDPAFAANYGATEAGALRGGINPATTSP